MTALPTERRMQMHHLRRHHSRISSSAFYFQQNDLQSAFALAFARVGRGLEWKAGWWRVYYSGRSAAPHHPRATIERERRLVRRYRNLQMTFLDPVPAR